MTVSFALFLVIFHYSYDGLRQLVNDRNDFAAKLNDIKPLLSAPEWQNFETVYFEDKTANNFTNTKSWLKLNDKTSTSSSILSYDWDANTNLYETIEEPLLFNPLKRSEIWRYFTHCLLHASGVHLWINVLLLLLSGIPLELVHDGANVSLIFTAGTIFGSFLSYATDTSLLVGASAGVYASWLGHSIQFGHFALKCNVQYVILIT